MDASSSLTSKHVVNGAAGGYWRLFFWGQYCALSPLSVPAALKGNILGPILFLLVFNVPHILARWFFTRWGETCAGNRRTATYSAKRNDGKPNLWRLDYRS